MADNTEKIKQLEEIVDGAITSISIDGVSTTLSIAQARKRLQELKNSDTTSIAAGKTRPVMTRINLGNAW